MNQEKKYDVFISYSTLDLEIATQVVNYLENKHYNCFFAYRDIPVGVVWASAITDALEQCNIMVVLYSEHYNQSQQVDREIELCCDVEHKPVITFKLSEAEMKGAKKFFLKNLNWISTNNNYIAYLPILLSNIVQHIGSPAISPSIIENNGREDKIYNETLSNLQLPNNKFNCYIGNHVTPEMIYQAVNIDESVFSFDFRGVYETCINWWKKNPAIYIMIEDVETKKIVGYINAMPINEEYYQLIRTGDVIDTQIPDDEIEMYDFPDTYRLYFSSIAIHPKYRNTSAFKALFDAFMIHMLELYNREIYFKSILADVVSDMGEKLCKCIGLQYIKDSNHGTKIYEGTLIPPTIRPTTLLCKRLVDNYSKLS